MIEIILVTMAAWPIGFAIWRIAERREREVMQRQARLWNVVARAARAEGK